MRIDSRHVDRDVERTCLGRSRIEIQRAALLGEAAVIGTKPHVTDAKDDLRMTRVDDVGAFRDGRGRYRRCENNINHRSKHAA